MKISVKYGGGFAEATLRPAMSKVERDRLFDNITLLTNFAHHYGLSQVSNRLEEALDALLNTTKPVSAQTKAAQPAFNSRRRRLQFVRCQERNASQPKHTKEQRVEARLGEQLMRELAEYQPRQAKG